MKKGMTIIEMMVAISIFTVGIGGFTILFVNTFKANSSILEEGQASSVAINVLRDLEQDLRKVVQGADGSFHIKQADDFELTVYLDDDNDGVVERVHYFLDLNADVLKKRGI